MKLWDSLGGRARSSATRTRGGWGDPAQLRADRPRGRALPRRRPAQRAPARRRATRCWCRPGRRSTARRSRPGTRRRSSPPSRRSRRRRRSTPTSRRAVGAGRPRPRPRAGAARHRAGHRLHRGRGDRAGAAAGGPADPRARRCASSPSVLERRPRRPRPGRAAARRDLSSRRSARASRAAPRWSSTWPGGRTSPSASCSAGSAAGAATDVVAGTPEQVADQIETWFTQGAADGFNVMRAVAALRARGVRRPRRADPARARAVPQRVRRRHAARALRAAAAGEPVRVRGCAGA